MSYRKIAVYTPELQKALGAKTKANPDLRVAYYNPYRDYHKKICFVIFKYDTRKIVENTTFLQMRSLMMKGTGPHYDEVTNNDNGAKAQMIVSGSANAVITKFSKAPTANDSRMPLIGPEPKLFKGFEYEYQPMSVTFWNNLLTFKERDENGTPIKIDKKK